MSETQNIPIRLTLQPLPTVVAGQLQFGVQRGKTVVDVQEMTPEMTQLTVTLAATAVPQPDRTFDWKGPFVHGRPGERFLYLNWGRQLAEGWHGVRRAKIPLGLIPVELVTKAVLGNGRLHGTLNGIARDGGPVAASVKSVKWQLQTNE